MQKQELLAITSARRVSDEAYFRLRRAIVTGYFEPGSRLVERELTAQLDVSRTPIREALQRLEQDCLVVSEPHRGYYVHQPTIEEAQEAYEMRRLLEAACGELSAARATDEDIEAMRLAVEKGDELLNSGDWSALLLANNEFHHLQAKASGNRFIETELRRIWAYVDLLRGRKWATTDRPIVGHDEHHAILDAITRRDPSLARKLNEVHVERAWRNISALMRQAAVSA